MILDWLHLASGSVWLGGLVGLARRLVEPPDTRRVAGLAVCVPRFSRVAFVSVLVLIGSGIGASLLHFPTLASLWQTSYGQGADRKIALLLLAMVLASGNLLRSKPRAGGCGIGIRRRSSASARLLRGLASGRGRADHRRAVRCCGTHQSAAAAKALASIGKPSAHVGPGPVVAVVNQGPYELVFRISPNKAVVPDSFAVTITKDGKPVRGADVTANFAMLDMEMPQLAYNLAERRPGVSRARERAGHGRDTGGSDFRGQTSGTAALRGRPSSTTPSDERAATSRGALLCGSRLLCSRWRSPRSRWVIVIVLLRDII